MNIESIEKFEKLLEEKTTLVVDFYAEWCGPCKMLLPVLTKINEENPEYNIVKVNIDNFPELADKYEVQTVPTMVFIKNQKIVDRHSGFLPKEALVEKIKKNI